MNLTNRAIYQKGAKPQRVKAIRNDARDRTCTLNITGICCNDPAQTVGCHLGLFGLSGMSQKADDINIIDACGPCHAVLDNRSQWGSAGLDFEMILRAFLFTLRNRRAAGLIKLGLET